MSRPWDVVQAPTSGDGPAGPLEEMFQEAPWVDTGGTAGVRPRS